MFLLAQNVRFYKMGYTRWNIDFKKNQLSGAQKNTYVLSNYGCYNRNISNF